MTGTSPQWTVRLTAAAASDFQRILEWTAEQFGERQAFVYAETLAMALEALAEGPSVIGAKPRDEIIKGLFSLHVARRGRKGRHFIMFRVAPRDHAIDVLRLLHDSMDLPRHFSGTDEEPL
jgi:toxin ParE1/3/4